MQDYRELSRKQILAGKSVSIVSKSLDKAYKQEHRIEFDKAMKAEYDALFPTYRTMDDAEYTMYQNECFGDGIEPILPIPQEETSVLVDYLEDTNYKTLAEWLAETIVTTPEEVDADGVVIVQEVTEAVRPYIIPLQSNIDTLVNEDVELVKYRGDTDKVTRNKTLDKLVVTANTVAYDANGKAIGNMASVVSLANWKFNQGLATGNSADVTYQAIYKDTTVVWKGADNVLHTVMVESVCEALEVSMIEVANLVAV